MQDITAPTGVNLMTLAPPLPPAEEEASEPEPPRKEEAKPDLAPDLFQPDFGAELGGVAMEGAIAIDLAGGANSAMKTEFVFESYELDQAPRAVVKTPPMYPFRARQQGIEGVVQVKILVQGGRLGGRSPDHGCAAAGHLRGIGPDGCSALAL